MADFPDDVLRHIFSYLPQETLVQCRFLSRSVEPLARALAFRSVRLERAGNIDPFLNVAKSERLRPFVRELTVDFSQGKIPTSDAAEYGARLAQHRRTLLALPLVRLFSGLRTLNLRLNRGKGHDGWAGRWRVDNGGVVTDIDVRFLPLLFTTLYTETILRCISGNWTKEAQDLWERRWRSWSEPRAEALISLSLDPSFQSVPELFDTVQSFPDKAINLSTLTISNLPEKNSEYLMSSAAMTHFLETQSLSKLQLLTTSDKDDDAPIRNFSLHDRYEFFEKLPSTWLSPRIADRLRTLSLFARDYWGWCPKMDFRLLSQGRNGTGGLSNLRSLALGKFVFSHQWQVDWVAQLGSDNGRGGLEELYLDDCPIMWRARLFGPVDSEGYPLREAMAGEEGGHPSAINWDATTVDVDLWWSTVLRQWRQKMPSLKVFKMGTGHWDGAFSTDVAMAQTASRGRVVEGAYMLAKGRDEDTVHLNYDKYFMDDRHKLGQDIIKDGVGINERRECLLQYVQFMGPRGSSPWVERDFKDALVLEYEDGYQRYEEARRQDEDALYALRASIGST